MHTVVTPLGAPADIDNLLGLKATASAPGDFAPAQGFNTQSEDQSEDQPSQVPFTLPAGAMFGLYSEKAFSEALGFAQHTVASWRKRGRGEGPNYTMIANRVFYQEKEILAWLDRNTSRYS